MIYDNICGSAITKSNETLVITDFIIGKVECFPGGQGKKDEKLIEK